MTEPLWRCPVSFCRHGCPVLPDNACVNRTSGEVLCEVCGMSVEKHKKFAYRSGMRHVYQTCDGRYWHT